jgi:hypothetical protein
MNFNLTSSSGGLVYHEGNKLIKKKFLKSLKYLYKSGKITKIVNKTVKPLNHNNPKNLTLKKYSIQKSY